MKFLRVGLIQTFLCPALLFCFLLGEADLLQAQVNLEEGLVAYYPFKGNSNDASGNNNHPVFNNANLTSDRFGQPNEAYRFNGVDNYMKILNSPSLNMPDTELSLSLWVKVNGFNPNCGGSTLIKKGREGLDRTGYYYLRFSDDNFNKGKGATCPAVPPDMDHQNFYSKLDRPLADPPPYIEPGKWYNLIYICSGNFAKLYVNCQLVSSAPVVDRSFTHDGDLFFGLNQNSVLPGWLNGELDEVRIYNRGLNSFEVNALGECNFPTSPACDLMLNLPSPGSKLTAGDIDVAGNKLTVEALFNRTEALNNGFHYGSLVSKHSSSSDANYSLTPNGCAITTQESGYKATFEDCSPELGKTYHVAMVYDGAFLKFYRNGKLLSQTACTGDLINNDWPATIGQISKGTDPVDDQFLGFIGEVRIWKAVRTEAELVAGMNMTLPDPANQAGLVAYYSFSDIKNKKGNGLFDATLHGAAVPLQKNINCMVASGNCATWEVIPRFTIPDTVCVNTPVKIVNTSKNVTKYRWSFGSYTVGIPEVIDLGRIGEDLNGAADMDYTFYNGNYYGFVLNYRPAKITRLDFGNSLLNTPTATDIGNLGDVLHDITEMNWESSALQVVQNQGRWYVFIVLGDHVSSRVPVPDRLLKLDFGTDLLNTSPAVTNWGNIGNMMNPQEFFMFQENNNWYGFVTSNGTYSLVRIDFTDNFDNKPTAVDFGSFDNKLLLPKGFCVVNDNGYWRMFVTNVGSNLIRLDFGSSLLNTPTATALQKPPGLTGPTELAIVKDFNHYLGLSFNTRLTFPGLTNLPVYGSYTIPGLPGRVRRMSKFFHVGEDIYCFLPTGYYSKPSNLVRVKLSGNLNPDFPYSTLETPDPVTYTATGKYRITLIVDDGMHSEASVCKEIVVMPQPEHKPIKTISICQGETVKLGSSSTIGDHIWNNGISADSIAVSTPGTYWVETNRFNCSNRDSFHVIVKNSPLDLGKDTSVCEGKNLILDTRINSAAYLWNTGNTSRTISIDAPGRYYVTIKQNACEFSDTILVDLYKKPVTSISGNTTICYNGSAQLSATGGSKYKWYPPASLSDADIQNPIAIPGRDTRYYVIITDNNQCEYLDSTNVFIHVPPPFSVDTPQPICEKDSVQLIASGGDSYTWEPAIGLNNDAIDNPRASPAETTDYSVTITETVCNESKTLSTRLTVMPLPAVTATRSNDIDCSIDRSQLNATGADQYTWTPAMTLSNQSIHNPIATPVATTEYIVKGTSLDGCEGFDTIVVKVDNVNKGGYEMPNAFTPNNDGLNDCYGVKYWGIINELEFSVYNRWGERIFFTKNTGQCWDGTYKGVKQNGGVYVYMIKAKTTCEPEVLRKGTFVLVR